MTGSLPYSIEQTEFFERCFRKFGKLYRREAIEPLLDALTNLAIDPYPTKSRQEPLPSKTQVLEGWTFHKLEIWLGKGASGQVRLMYLVNEEARIIRPIWVYNHEQFAKRPDEQDLRNVIENALEI